MRKRMGRIAKAVGSLALLAVVAMTGVTLTSSPAEALPGPGFGPVGGPLCGWSALWTCTLPDGTERVIAGTQCDIARFEQKTGATCTLGT